MRPFHTHITSPRILVSPPPSAGAAGERARREAVEVFNRNCEMVVRASRKNTWQAVQYELDNIADVR